MLTCSDLGFVKDGSLALLWGYSSVSDFSVMPGDCAFSYSRGPWKMRLGHRLLGLCLGWRKKHCEIVRSYCSAEFIPLKAD